jgi:hypothetical protein
VSRLRGRARRTLLWLATTDGPLADGTAYTYRLSTYRGTWSSSTVTAVLTPSC